MASEEIINIFSPFVTPFVNSFGLTPEAMITTIVVFGAAILALRTAAKSQHKDVGLAVFFSLLFFSAFLGLISFFTIAVPLILIALYFWYTKRGNG